jgi:hypothetical protein
VDYLHRANLYEDFQVLLLSVIGDSCFALKKIKVLRSMYRIRETGDAGGMSDDPVRRLRRTTVQTAPTGGRPAAGLPADAANADYHWALFEFDGGKRGGSSLSAIDDIARSLSRKNKFTCQSIRSR